MYCFRHHGGSEIIDSIELLCQKRSLEAFHLSSEEWGCNVQPYSGTPANLAALLAAAPPSKDPNTRRPRVMGLKVPHGGHFTHGYEKNEERSGTNIFFDTQSYKVLEILKFKGTIFNFISFRLIRKRG